MRRRTVLWTTAAAVTLVLVALTPIGGGVQAASSYSPFGWGKSVGRGLYGSPQVVLESTTPAHPAAARFVITAPDGKNRTVSITWYLRCWQGSLLEQKRASLEKVTPYTREFTTLPLGDPDYCELDVSAQHTSTGALKVVLESK